MEDELGRLVDALPGFVWTALPDGQCNFVNKRWREYTGLGLQEAAGRGWLSAVHPEDLPGVLLRWRAILDSGEAGELEARLRRCDGSYRWFSIATNPLRGDLGRVMKWCGLNTDIEDRVDIEDRKRAEDALRASERSLSLIINTIPMLAWATRPDGFCDFLNQRWLDYAGMPAEQAYGWGWAAAIHPEDAERLQEYWRSCLASGTPADTEARLRRFDGVYRWFLFRDNPLRDEAGNILKWYGTAVDIEDRRRSEQALAKVRSELAYITRVASLGVLTASIAHEVNQPLSGIITNANTCLRMLAANPPNVEGAVETARRTIRDGNRASEVIIRLRALFSKKNTGTEPVDLNEATREVVALSVNELQRNRVMLRTELDGDLPAITGDRIQLQQVILNLLMNASAAMNDVEDRPRQLVIRTELDSEDSVRLSVQDAGVGIGTEDTDRLFEAFYTTKSTGMGIGLSVSRSIIENHEGRLWAISNQGPGATFSFSIPRAGGLAAT
jgi:hypothetical protein